MDNRLRKNIKEPKSDPYIMKLIDKFGEKLNRQKSIKSIITELYYNAYIARNKHNDLFLFLDNPPIRAEELLSWLRAGSGVIRINENLFPNLKYEDEPIKVKVTLNIEE